jgi:ribonuclease-3
MSKMRSRMVNRETLNDIARSIGIDKFVQYDKSIKIDERNAIDMFGNSLEAFIGAIYIDKGYGFTEKYILEKIFNEHIDLEEVEKIEQNYKGRLFEYAQKNSKKLVFEIEEYQDDNETKYRARVLIDDEIMGEGIGFRKKIAEQESSKVAFQAISKNKL